MAARKTGRSSESEVFKLELLMKQAGVTVHDRKVVDAALSYAEETGGPAAALELDNGKMILGKTSDLLGALSAVLLNSLKELAGIDRHYHVISPLPSNRSSFSRPSIWQLQPETSHG